MDREASTDNRNQGGGSCLTCNEESDLIIAVGYDLVEYNPKNWNGDLSKKIIHIDFTPAEVDTYYPPTIEIAADIEYTIKAIIEEIDKVKKNTIPRKKKLIIVESCAR